MTAGLQLLVLLHGFEDEPSRLGAVAGALDPRAGATRVVVPRGPHETPDGPIWLSTLDPDPDEVTATLDRLDQLIDAECAALGCGRGQVVVGGFSQGGAVALALALRDVGHPPLGGCFVICGFLWPPDAVVYDPARVVDTTAFLGVHGDDDEAVPVQQGRSASRWLARHGAAVVFHEHEGAGHHLDPAYLDDVRDWLTAIDRGERPSLPPA